MRHPVSVRRRHAVSCAALIGASCLSAHARPENVRAWYAAGQVFVVWENGGAAPLPTDTVEISLSVASMVRIGRVFPAESAGTRLTALRPGARLLVPTPVGGGSRLSPDGGVFAFTPRAAGAGFLARFGEGC